MLPAAQTPEQREKARQTRHDRQNQKAAEAAATVDALLAGAGGKLPSYAQAHVTRARRGNVRALISLKCLDCTCWSKTEVAACPVTACPLHPLRPYRK
jgi:protein involved in polysaccharide export with SLBB domain